MFIKHFILCHRYNLHTFYLDSSFHLLLAGLFSCNWWDPTFPTSWHSCEHRASIRGSASLFCKLTFMSSIDLSSHLHVITLHLPLHLHRVSHNYTSWLLKAIRAEPGLLSPGSLSSSSLSSPSSPPGGHGAGPWPDGAVELVHGGEPREMLLAFPQHFCWEMGETGDDDNE